MVAVISLMESSAIIMGIILMMIYDADVRSKIKFAETIKPSFPFDKVLHTDQTQNVISNVL